MGDSNFTSSEGKKNEYSLYSVQAADFFFFFLKLCQVPLSDCLARGNIYQVLLHNIALGYF